MGDWIVQFDDRENVNGSKIDKDKIIKYLKTKYEIKRSGIGDIVIRYANATNIVIERKIWRDLAASIKDGRLDTQIPALAQIAERGVRVLLLVEGIKAASFENLPMKQLQKTLDGTFIKYGISIYYTDGWPDTLRLIDRLIDNYPPEFLVTQNLAVGGEEVKLVKPPNTVEHQAIQCLSAIPNVSIQTARVLLGKHTILQLRSIPESEIAELLYPGGTKIGPARAKTIKDNLSERMWKVLSEGITGVTEETAKLIISLDNPTFETISELKKINGRRLGSTVARRVVDVVTFSLSS